jgi:short-chain fatty acids transporter
MLAGVGSFFAVRFRRWLPDSFVFAILLTFVAAILAMLLVDASPFGVVQAWYQGFWSLLQFAMQMVLILVTGYAIAISEPAGRFTDRLARRVSKPALVYGTVVFIGCVFALVSWGWIVLTAVLARALAERVKGVDYRLLAACVYVTNLPWHGGLSGSIPLLINTPGNFLIDAGVLTGVVPTAVTLASPMNLVTNLLLVLTLPALMILMSPAPEKVVTLDHLRDEKGGGKEISIEDEARQLRLPGRNLSDLLNNSFILQMMISLTGLSYLIWHFTRHGFDINLDIMNFLFIVVGMLLHKTPLRYAIALRRSCSNVSGIVLQFPFYAGIMGIMIHTGLGSAIAGWLSAVASVAIYPFWAFVMAAVLNIFVPSGGGEWAVVGSTIVQAAQSIGSSMTPDEMTHFIAKSSMAAAYGDALTNMIQPFWTLAFLPIVGAGVKLQARDFMGYTFVAMLWAFVVFAGCILLVPV